MAQSNVTFRQQYASNAQAKLPQPPIVDHIEGLKSLDPRHLTRLDRKLLQAEHLSSIWDRVCKYAHEGDFRQAYKLALSQTDDVYLLRLLLQTGPVTRSLDETTNRKVLDRLNRMSRSNPLLRLEIEWLEDSRKLFKNISRGEQNEYLDSLYQIGRAEHQLAKTEMKERANELFGSLKRSAMLQTSHRT